MAASASGTFVAAVRSVATAATMAGAGFYLHRRKFVTPEGKKTLAKMSQQVTIPALFFTKIIACPQNYSLEPCPNITDNLSDVWIMAFWPFFVVGFGLLVGDAAARISGTPPWQKRAVIAACAFANSTGLPITLLTVVHANFPATTELGRVDPNLFLSVYLLLYPILQWGIGGWLLAPGDDTEQVEMVQFQSTRTTGVHHVLNIPQNGNEESGQNQLASIHMVKQLSLTDLLELKAQRERENSPRIAAKPLDSPTFDNDDDAPSTATTASVEETAQLINNSPEPNKEVHEESRMFQQMTPSNDVAPLRETLTKVLPKALQPPVIAAMLGLLIAAFPTLRGIFVDLQTRADKAPLQWLFDGLHAIGQAAVPINMTILGTNLSMTIQNKQSSTTAISNKTVAAIVVSKMMVMPLIGITTAIILKQYIWNIPDEIDGPFYLVLMVVTITPTANNVMVMVELSGSSSKEGMARILGWQYAVAPIVLSVSVMIVVRVANLW